MSIFMGPLVVLYASASMWDNWMHKYTDGSTHLYAAFGFAALSTAPRSSENRTDEDTEESQEPEQENDLWKNIKDFAG